MELRRIPAAVVGGEDERPIMTVDQVVGRIAEMGHAVVRSDAAFLNSAGIRSGNDAGSLPGLPFRLAVFLRVHEHFNGVRIGAVLAEVPRLDRV
ncbi:hypothetical protein D3C80_2036450 [compost metagenome]